jgi:hypothetical protein
MGHDARLDRWRAISSSEIEIDENLCVIIRPDRRADRTRAHRFLSLQNEKKATALVDEIDRIIRSEGGKA